MPRKRTGTLIRKAAGFGALVTLEGEDGKTERRWINLETTDRALARRKLAKLVDGIERGLIRAPSHEEVTRPETVEDFARGWIARRVDAKIVMASDERNHLDAHILPILGPLLLDEVRPPQIREVLDECVGKGLSREMVKKVRGTMSRLFKAAWQEEILPENPVSRTEVPDGAPHDERARTILSDDEIASFLASPVVDLEMKVLSITSRVLGGVRASQLNRWDWSAIDRDTFERVKIPMAKQKRGTVGRVHDFIVPEAMRSILRLWWEGQGSPASGPVFPVRKGERAGDFKAGRQAYAFRLRRELFRAGIVRLPPVVAKEGKREVSRPNPADPLFFETVATRPVDFHSFRRAFNTAIAAAGVNVQKAMQLTGHTDARVHARYIMTTDENRRIPEGAVPRELQLTVTNRKAKPSDPCQEPRESVQKNKIAPIAQLDRATVSEADGQRAEIPENVGDRGSDGASRGGDRVAVFVRDSGDSSRGYVSPVTNARRRLFRARSWEWFASRPLKEASSST